MSQNLLGWYAALDSYKLVHRTGFVFKKKTGNTQSVILTVRGQTLSRSYGRLFAEFLNEESLVRLGLLDLSTCVGLRYGWRVPRVILLF